MGAYYMASFDPAAAARFIADAHEQQADYCNLPVDLAPPTIADAYAAQEALAEIWSARYGHVAGLKIATTTKVMQALMGIDHPCGGMIFHDRIHRSPATLKASDYIHLMIECELAVRVGVDLPGTGSPYDRRSVRAAVAEVMPAFELIEDRNAVYKETDARSLIADDAWNAGIVLGPSLAVDQDRDLNGLKGRLWVNGEPHGDGLTDDPMGALAWCANLAVERGRPLKAGMIVITGSVVATLPISPGDHFSFEIENIGETVMTLEA